MSEDQRHLLTAYDPGLFLNHYEVYDDDGEPTGKFLTGMDGSFDLNAVADAVIAESLRAGYAIVALPEPDEGRHDWLDATVRVGPDREPRTVDIEMDRSSHVVGVSTEFARDLAAALLAAADVAEREQ